MIEVVVVETSTGTRVPTGSVEKPPATWLGVLGQFLERVSKTFLPFAIFGALVVAIAGGLGETIGLPTLFRDDPDLRKFPFLFFDLKFPFFHSWILNSPAICGHAAATILLMVIWDGIDVYERLIRHLRHPEVDPELRSLKERGVLIASNSAPFLAALLVAAAWPELKQPFDGIAFVVEVGEAIAGIVVGAILGIAVVMGVEWLREVLVTRFGGNRIALSFVAKLRWFALPPGEGKFSSKVVDDFWVFLSPIFVLVGFVIVWRVIVPAVAIVTLAVFVVTAYFLVLYIRPALRVPLLLAYVLALGFFVGHPLRKHFRERFPGLDVYESEPVKLLGPRKSWDWIEPDAALTNWAALPYWAGKGERRKLVIVSVSGGAYRAGFWTAKVLDRILLESRKQGSPIADLPRSIRLLTGASGGMVASAYFAALASPADEKAPIWPSIEESLLKDIHANRNRDGGGKFRTEFPINRDGLSPVAQQMVQRDVVRYLLAPFLSWNPLGDWDLWSDRGAILEEQWRALRTTFSDLARGERDGSRPAIILSPMMVETGQPLLVSNLDLHELVAENHAVEFFSLFPDARSSFRLQTAVRMNASFPYVSPAVALPTDQPRRVVDAGYYDNYGVGVAASYLALANVRKWISENKIERVIVIQVRAYASKQADKICSPEGIGAAAEFLTSPPSAVFAARDSSMVFRNAEQLTAVGSLYQKDLVQTCVFENAADPEVDCEKNRHRKPGVEMSWYLTPHSMDEMTDQLKTAQNEEALDCVIGAWMGKTPESKTAAGKSSGRLNQ